MSEVLENVKWCQKIQKRVINRRNAKVMPQKAQIRLLQQPEMGFKMIDF